MSRRFFTLDVFTSEALAGNPLAVVLDAVGLDTDRMQAITREFNLSETVFVSQPADTRHRAALRIFTPGKELPFAGHPTIGTAVLLAILDRRGEAGSSIFGLEEKIGIVPCAVDVRDADFGAARFRAPRLPAFLREGPSTLLCARALGLDPREIGCGKHMPSRHSAGVAFDFVPVADRETLSRVRIDPQGFADAFADSDHPAAYVYTVERRPEGLVIHSRMFSPDLAAGEDPASGSGAVAFAGVLMQFEPLASGVNDIAVHQGDDMGRPSRIALQVMVEDGALAGIELGGSAVIVSEGTLRL
jgi:trans-2,3-dihydro-3-hydroxyanthranilate isomerase